MSDLQKALIPICLFLFVFATSSLQAQEGWSLAKEKDGVAVYTRAVPGEVLKASRAIVHLKTPPNKLLALLRDVDRNEEWMDRVTESRLLKKYGPNEVVYHAKLDVPWPLAKRDMVVRVKITPTDQGYLILSSNEPNFIPPEEGVIRLPKMESRWEVTLLNDGSMKIVQETLTSPGGKVPDWLANAGVTDGPIATMTNLRRLVEEN
jgi:hypothetical protein